MPRMPKTSRIDLADRFPDTSTVEVPFVVVGPIFGRDWKVLQDINSFTALDADNDAANYAQLLSNAIHEDDKAEFLRMLKSQRQMDAPKLMELLNAILEAASGNPTPSSSGSGTGTAKRAAVRRSAAS